MNMPSNSCILKTTRTGLGSPCETLSEIHDMLVLALDATESRTGYPQPMREARSYLRRALRQTGKLLEGGAA